MAKFKINIGSWTEYRADGSLELPINDRQPSGWVCSSGGASPTYGVIACTSGSVPSGYVLRVYAQANGTDKCSFAHNFGTVPFFLNVSNARGYTIEAQMKCISAGTSGGQMLMWYDDKYRECLDFRTNHIKLISGVVNASLNTTLDFYTYRITVKDTACKVYVNDALSFTGVLGGSAGYVAGSYGIEFGDLFSTAAYGGLCEWAYVRYRTDGAYAPNEISNDGWTYSKFDITDARRMQEFNIIRSQNTIIPEGNMSPVKLKVSGTISGGNWMGLQNVVRRFKRFLHSGTQRIYIDDTRYMEGIHSGFTLKPDTQDFAKYDASFTCQYPFWSQSHGSYFTTAPVSAATFYVTNNGDIEVPLKLILTGAPASTIVDNVQIQNVTTGQLFEYRGTLTPTAELIIDKGYDAYSVYKVEVFGTNQFANFEGDLLTIAPGINKFTFKGGAVGTIELYWREAFLL